MFISETCLIVRYAETDQMGIVHHSNYPIWFEAGRTDFIRKLGMPYSNVEKYGFMLPLIELSCKYKGSAKYEDEIVVKTNVKEVERTKLVFYYQVFKNDHKEPITTGETVHVWTDKQMKPVNIKKKSPDIYNLLCFACQQ